MGWAKYDDDNRDAIEERNAGKGSFDPPVFNYTSDHPAARQRALAACYAGHYGTPEDKEA